MIQYPVLMLMLTLGAVEEFKVKVQEYLTNGRKAWIQFRAGASRRPVVPESVIGTVRLSS